MDKFKDVFGAPKHEYPGYRFFKMMFRKRRKDEQDKHNNNISGAALMMTGQMTWLDFAALAMGTMIATGIFSLMPKQYLFLGPALLISFFLSFMVATLTAVIYSEFAVLYPVVGGAFVYTLNTLGELPAVLCGTAMAMAYLFTIGAVSRHFSAYFAQLIQCDPNIFQVHVRAVQSDRLDWLAVLIIIVLMVFLCSSTKVFHRGNLVLQAIHIVIIFVILIVVLFNVRRGNWTPFFPQLPKEDSPYIVSGENVTTRNVVIGGSLIFFTFLGYEVVVMGAEEARDKKSSVPRGMIGAIVFTTVLYFLMVAALISLVDPVTLGEHYQQDKRYNGFALAFMVRNLKAMRQVVAAGACIGIFTSTGINMWTMARLLVAFAREGMLPAWVGRLHQSSRMPIRAVVIAGIIAGALAFFTEFHTLSSMGSISFLIMFWFVAVAHIFIRYSPHGYTPTEHGEGHIESTRESRINNKRSALVLIFIALLTISSIGFTWYWNVKPESSGWLIACVVAWFILTVVLWLTLPIAFTPSDFAVPKWAIPWVPSMSIFSTILLMGSEGKANDFVRVGVAMCIGVLVYCLFGVHTTYYRFVLEPKEIPLISMQAHEDS